MAIKAVIAGIDEAGRGALAGPVVAAACILKTTLVQRTSPFLHWVPAKSKNHASSCRIADSKKLKPEEREEAFQWITKHAACGIGIVSSEEVESLGILSATEKAMQKAVRHLSAIEVPTYLLVDGRDAFWFDTPHSSVIGGEGLEPCIAAASILAKVTRDRWMVSISKRHQQFGFEKHKGYGTKDHFAALMKYGPCRIHRKNFLHALLEKRLENF